MSDSIDLDALAEAYNRGLELERDGDRAGAVAAYAQALALDPDDHGGVSIRLAALGAGATPATAPPAYVATLFDQTAPDFDDILVERLGYCVPLTLRETLRARGQAKVGRLLDLGCGTGLAGLALADLAGEVVGVDLSEGMLAEADARGCYHALYVGDAVAFLEGREPGEAPFDMIVATDMLPYLGAVEPLFAGACACLAPGGLLAVSTEAGDAAPGYAVGPGHRYAHAPEYLSSALAAAGFAAPEMIDITVRFNDGAPVAGHLVLAERL